MELSQDFSDFLTCIPESGVEFVLVDVYAMAARGIVRNTGGIDLLLRPKAENETRLHQTLMKFGFPSLLARQFIVAEEDLVNTLGNPPRRIDMITGLPGVGFNEAKATSMLLEVESVGAIPVMSLEALETNKLATGRTNDLADVETIQMHLKERDGSDR
jgi:hypothetical protein